jgi:hypothetical protein
MSSSTSISEPLAWWRWLRRYAIACVLLAAAFAFGQVALDPYDTGRLALFADYGVPPFGPRLSSASLARQPETEAATIGNSTIQHLNPTRLTALSGLRFVSLALPATGPIEQLAVARWLVRHHDGRAAKPLGAVVFGIDTRWCRGDGTIELSNPFPFWLYSDTHLIYAVNLVSLGTFGAVGKKLKLMLGWSEPMRGQGYHEYDSEWPWNTAADLRAGTQGYELFGHDFAGVRHLKEFLPGVPAETVVILLFPPRYYSSLPIPGASFGTDYAECKAAYGAVAASRPRTVVLDLLKDDPLVHHDEYFLDRAHYLSPISDKVEEAIAETIKANFPGESHHPAMLKFNAR